MSAPGTVARGRAGASGATHHEPAPTGGRGLHGLVIYLLIGAYFGIVITKAQVVSWFRIQEMFRFESFHMYGIIGTAIAVAALSVAIVRRRPLRSFEGTPISLPRKELGTGIRYVAGGSLFGIGWALTGACPGPLLALVGNGVTVMAAGVLSALAGTWTYGLLRRRLPH